MGARGGGLPWPCLMGEEAGWPRLPFAPLLSISADGSKQGISHRPRLTWLSFVLQFHSALALGPPEDLSTFKLYVDSLLCDGVEPIGQATRLESSRGTHCSFPVTLSILLLYSRSPGWHISFIH